MEYRFLSFNASRTRLEPCPIKAAERRSLHAEIRDGGQKHVVITLHNWLERWEQRMHTYCMNLAILARLLLLSSRVAPICYKFSIFWTIWPSCFGCLWLWTVSGWNLLFLHLVWTVAWRKVYTARRMCRKISLNLGSGCKNRSSSTSRLPERSFSNQRFRMSNQANQFQCPRRLHQASQNLVSSDLPRFATASQLWFLRCIEVHFGLVSAISWCISQCGGGLLACKCQCPFSIKAAVGRSNFVPQFSIPCAVTLLDDSTWKSAFTAFASLFCAAAVRYVCCVCGFGSKTTLGSSNQISQRSGCWRVFKTHGEAGVQHSS